MLKSNIYAAEQPKRTRQKLVPERVGTEETPIAAKLTAEAEPDAFGGYACRRKWTG